MDPALWGLLTATGWGTADFIARFTGRAVGPRRALFGMLLTSAVVLSAIVVATGWSSPGGSLALWPSDPGAGGWLWAGAMGVGITAGTLLLYWGLARGPVAVVAPVVAAYPAFNLLIAVAGGSRPPWAQWAAMATVMAGVSLVIVLAPPADGGAAAHSRRHVRDSAAIALLASVVFALTLEAAQGSSAAFGGVQAVWLSRVVGVGLMVGFLVLGRDRPTLPARTWPLVTAQGLLDGGAYLALLAGSEGAGAEVTIVVSSTFAAVTVALARVVLKEAMSWGQWGAIALVVAGVAYLSGVG